MKTYSKVFLILCLGMIYIMTAYKACTPIEQDGVMPVVRFQDGVEQAPAIIADTYYFTQHPADNELPRAKTVQNPTQNTTEIPLPTTDNISQHHAPSGMDWLFNGSMSAGILGLLAFVIKSDRENMKKLADAVDCIADNNAALRSDIQSVKDGQTRIEQQIRDLNR